MLLGSEIFFFKLCNIIAPSSAYPAIVLLELFFIAFTIEQFWIQVLTVLSKVRHMGTRAECVHQKLLNRQTVCAEWAEWLPILPFFQILEHCGTPSSSSTTLWQHQLKRKWGQEELADKMFTLLPHYFCSSTTHQKPRKSSASLHLPKVPKEQYKTQNLMNDKSSW